jgi:hypothetical protein
LHPALKFGVEEPNHGVFVIRCLVAEARHMRHQNIATAKEAKIAKNAESVTTQIGTKAQSGKGTK